MSIQNSGSIPSKPWYKLIAPASDLHQSYRDTVHGIFLGPVTLSMLVAQYVEEVSCDIIMLVAPRICSRFKSEHKLYFLSKYWKGNLKTLSYNKYVAIKRFIFFYWGLTFRRGNTCSSPQPSLQAEISPPFISGTYSVILFYYYIFIYVVINCILCKIW